MNFKMHQSLATAFACTILLIVSTGAYAQDIVTDPFPEKIKRGKIKISLRNVATKLTGPVYATAPRHKKNVLFVVDQGGKIHVIKDGKLLKTPALDISNRLVKIKKGFDERGLLGLAFHPGFVYGKSLGHQKLYTYSSEKLAPGEKVDFTVKMPKGKKLDHKSVIAEWKVSSANPHIIDPSSRRVVMTIGQPTWNHNGGALAFGPDGMLYIALGDGGHSNDKGAGHSKGGNGQDLTNVLGTILRIDPLSKKGKKSANGQYSIPADNPRVGRKGIDEIYAWGQRNPWRMSFDRKTGDLIVGDIGQMQIEEVNIIKKGGNYGWPIKEGNFYFNQATAGITRNPPNGKRIPADLIGPAIAYDHSDGLSVIGGFVYHGQAIPELKGKYIFGEWKSTSPSNPKAGFEFRLFAGNLKTGAIEELNLVNESKRYKQFLFGFGQDDAGELYALSNGRNSPVGKPTGNVWKIVPARKINE